MQDIYSVYTHIGTEYPSLIMGLIGIICIIVCTDPKSRENARFKKIQTKKTTSY